MRYYLEYDNYDNLLCINEVKYSGRINRYYSQGWITPTLGGIF
jgi:hypothetical protein